MQANDISCYAGQRSDDATLPMHVLVLGGEKRNGIGERGVTPFHSFPLTFAFAFSSLLPFSQKMFDSSFKFGSQSVLICWYASIVNDVAMVQC